MALLKLDGRTVRGRLWKEMNTSGKPLKQGVLLNKTTCSNCHVAPDVEDITIECMSCHLTFHTSCLLIPVSEQFVKDIAINPSIWWFCPACVTCKSGDTNTDVPINMVESNSVGSDVIMKNTLMTFKKDILELVSETMDNKFKKFANLIDNNNDNRKTANPDQVKNMVNITDPAVVTKENKAWGEPSRSIIQSRISTNDFPSISQSNGQNKDKVDKVQAPIQKSEKHVLILEPSDDNNLRSEENKKRDINSVYKALSDINVEFCSVRKSGNIAIGFPNSDTKKVAEERFRTDEACSSAFTSRVPKKMMPKVTVNGISEMLFDSHNTEDRGELKSVLLNDILLRNKGIQTIIDSDSTEFLNVVTVQKTMPTSNLVSYTAVLKMSCKIRQFIQRNGDKLYIFLKRCRVYDRFHVSQCYHCQLPGHISNNCPDKKENKLPTCLYCSQFHSSKDCPKKGVKSDQCCTNCLKSSNPIFVQEARNHNAASYKCPIIQAYMGNLKANTEDWQAKKYYS